MDPIELTPEELEVLWEQAKRAHAVCHPFIGGNFIECDKHYWHIHRTPYGLEKHWREGHYEKDFIRTVDDFRLAEVRNG